MFAVSRSVLSAVVLASVAFAQYDYDANSTIGPEYWGTLNLTGKVNQCAGDKNSPIALNTTACTDFADYSFQAGTCTMEDVTFELLKNAVEVAYPNSTVCDSGTLTIPGVDDQFNILQFHIHTSSEHTLDGQFFGAELHIVHVNADASRLAVVGIFLQPDSPNDQPLFDMLLNEWQVEYSNVLSACNISSSTARSIGGRGLLRETSSKNRRLETFNVYDLIPSGSTFYNYDGSLTTPPCSEIVWWNVADTPLSISVRQFAELASLVENYRDSSTCELASIASVSGSTSRPVQDWNGRTVKRICPVGYVEPAPAPAPTTSTKSTSAASISVLSFVSVMAGVIASGIALF